MAERMNLTPETRDPSLQDAVAGRISVCVPAYGRGRFLDRTLRSLLAQTRPASEIIVVDDCSPDDTSSIARAYAAKGVRYVRNSENLGVPVNYNHALGMG